MSSGPALEPLKAPDLAGEVLGAQESSPSLQELSALKASLLSRQASKGQLKISLVEASSRLKQWVTKPEPPVEPPASASAVDTSLPVLSTSPKERFTSPKLTNGNGRASSPDVSGNDSAHRKKRKHDKLVIGSDDDYSESETQTQAVEPPAAKVRKLDRLDPQQTSVLETLPLPGHTRPLERKDSSQKVSSAGSPSAQSPSGTPSGLSLKLKLSQPPPRKIEAPIRRGPLPPGTADDFSMPSRPLVPPRPMTVPPTPLPKSQIEVTGDFDVPKPNQQTPYSTFVTSVEPYLRSFGDDDLAFLSVKSEDIQPFLIPALGRYYAEQWADEDSGVFPSPSRSTALPNTSPLKPPPLQRSRPSDLTDDSLSTEHVAMGPLSERLVAAFGEEGLGDLTNDMSLDEADASVASSHPMDALELEDRLKKELRFLGVFPTDSLAPLSASLSSVAATGEVDWSARTDDEISTALRACQRALRDQIGVNEARKARLAALVRDRMAYQEFEGTRDGLEKVIETGWIKRQRHGKPKKIKPKPGEKASSVPPAAAGAASSQPAGTSATAPEKTIKEPMPPMPEELVLQLDRRRRYIDAFEDLFGNPEEGKWRGMPLQSVYDDEAKVDSVPMSKGDSVMTNSNVQ